MKPFHWVLLCVVMTIYLLLGGAVFMYFEQHREIEKIEEITVLRKDIKEILLHLDREFYNTNATSEIIEALRAAKEGVINRISSACNIDSLIEGDYATSPFNQEDDSNLTWNFYNSVFFAFTVITTIGYGHLSPSTTWSKGFVIIYALIGIPINSILLSGVGDYFSSKLIKVHKKSKQKKHASRRFTFIFEIIFYLIPGLIAFILIPAGVFVLIESWTFMDSVYYAFITLSTIGFGDYVAGMGSGHTVWMWVYKSSIIIWITFGLGYLIMILGFITKGMKSKKVRVVIEKRLNTIRFTKDKLTKDIDYMRRVVNELYLMKINPVYEIEKDSDSETINKKLDRTQSQPCIRFERRCSSLPRLGRGHVSLSPMPHPSDKKGAHQLPATQAVPRKISKLTRRCSDSDLSKINRDKTFENAIKNFVTADELLVSVVNALSGDMMHDVMDAVDELNDLERISIAGNEYDETRPRTRTNSDEDFGFEDVPSWDLGTVSESDEENLLESDKKYESKLEQVVVHGRKYPEESGHPKSNPTLMGKVSGVIRKISSGKQSPAEGPSRNVSRQEHDRMRKISRIESIDRNLKHNGHGGPRTFLNPHAFAPGVDRKISQLSVHERKISAESRISNSSGRSRIDDLLNSNVGSRKTTPTGTPQHPPSQPQHKLSLETTSLAEFLKALDTVHSRLSVKTSVDSSKNFNPGDPLTPWSPIRKSARRRQSSVGETSVSSPRRRKVGVVHPAFSYVNHGFHQDDDDEKNVKDKGSQL